MASKKFLWHLFIKDLANCTILSESKYIYFWPYISFSSFRTNLVPFRTFRGPRSPKPVFFDIFWICFFPHWHYWIFKNLFVMEWPNPLRMRRRHGRFPFTSGLPRVKGKVIPHKSREVHTNSPRHGLAGVVKNKFLPREAKPAKLWHGELVWTSRDLWGITFPFTCGKPLVKGNLPCLCLILNGLGQFRSCKSKFSRIFWPFFFFKSNLIG